MAYISPSFPGTLKTFPCRYLGLPLHFRKLRKVDFLLLIEKIGSRLPGWKGCYFTSEGRRILVQSVLSTMPTYHLSAVQAPKWVIKRIDRFRRSFLWKGEDPSKTNPGSSLVNWNTVCKPKSLGGLGIPDLEKFSRALRLRWLWFKWKDDNKPWIGMDIPCDDSDIRLFQAATTITLGNGEKTGFWHDKWLQNSCPKDIAPMCFSLAKRKQRPVKTELTNNSWLLSLRNITSIEEINELVQLGGLLQNVQLQQNAADDIRWNWNESGSYSAKSAYLFQFQGSFSPIDFYSIWKSEAEPMMRFFGWLILHKKTPTAQNLLRRHWPCNWICSLCGEAFEDTNHLFNECSFFRKVWLSICHWQNIPGAQLSDDNGAWWTGLNQLYPKSLQTKVRGSLLATWWNVWLERNRRIFQSISSDENCIARIVQEELDLRRSAFQPP